MEVQIVKSGKDEGAPDPQAWAQYSANETATKLLGDATWSWKSLGFASKAAATAAVCERLHVAHLHYTNNEDSYPDGRFINDHAKNVLADDRALYTGSANAYSTTPATLAEFGVVLEGDLDEYRDYWDR